MTDENDTGTDATTAKPRSSRSWIGAGLAAAVLVGLFLLVGWSVHASRMNSRLLTTDPDQLTRYPELVSYAVDMARPVYAKRCASCHGAQMQGDQSKGAPNLKDSIWLYDDGGVGDLERTILYGIRSGNAKSRNITDMPALGRTMQLSSAEIEDVTTFVLSLTHPQQDPAAVARGSAIFENKGVCYDCHSADAGGNPDYGAPAFTDQDWLYGGSREAIRRSISDGRHGHCPAWIGTLKPAVIRSLAVYLHQVSHKPAAPQGSPHG